MSPVTNFLTFSHFSIFMNYFSDLRIFAVVWGRDICSVFVILAETCLRLPSIFHGPGKNIFFRQVYFSGIEALPILSIAALLAGYLALHQLFGVLGRDLQLTLDVFRSMLVQEGAVLMVALFVLARSGSAMSSELAGMRLNGEIPAIWRLGIDVAEFLVIPRVAACAVSVAALAVYVQMLLVFGGIALMALFHEWDYLLAMDKFLRGIQPAQAILTVFRTLAFGASIAAVACSSGLRAKPGPSGVPIATRGAVVTGFAAILILQALFGFFT